MKPLASRSDAGFSVVVVTATILVMLILGLALVQLVSENSGLALHHVQSNQALYAAQAGAEYAIVKLAATPTWGGLPLPGKSLGASSFWIAPPDTLDAQGSPLPAGQKRLVATGVAGEATRVIEIQILTSGTISTYAGIGTAGYTGDGGPATAAKLRNPEGVSAGPDGSIYIIDNDNDAIRKVDVLSGIITTVSGTGAAGYTGDGGPATAARLNQAEDAAVAANGDIYIADTANHVIRKVAAATGIISTYAGTGTAGTTGDGGAATAATLRSPKGISIAANGDIYVADSGNDRIRKITAATGIITAYAGTGTGGYSGDGGLATAAKLSNPQGIEVAANGDVYIADTTSDRVRRVAAATGIITTVAGTGTAGYQGDGGPATSARLKAPQALTLGPTGDIYVADSGNHVIRRFALGGVITTIAGTGSSGFTGDGGLATLAKMNSPRGIAVNASGSIFIGDRSNRRIRRVSGVMSIAGWAEPRV